MEKYEDLPINVGKAGSVFIVAIPGLATAMSPNLEEALQQAIGGFLTKFFENCAAEDKIKKTP